MQEGSAKCHASDVIHAERQGCHRHRSQGTPEQGSIRRGGEWEGRGLGPKILCAKNGQTRFPRCKCSFFPTLVTLVWRGGSRGGGGAAMVYGHSNASLPLSNPRLPA